MFIVRVNLNFSVIDATINAYKVAIGAAIKASIPVIINPANTNTGENLNNPIKKNIKLSKKITIQFDELFCAKCQKEVLLVER